MITLSVDHAHCPACELSPLIKITAKQRQCNACGFSAVLVTPEDEQEAEREAQIKRNDRGKQHSISRYQTTW